MILQQRIIRFKRKRYQYSFLHPHFFSYETMSLPPPWIENYSKRNKMYYYYNTATNASLWKMESVEKGWGRTLKDNKHPELGEKFVNIFTNKELNSKEEYENYIKSYNTSQYSNKEESNRVDSPQTRIHLLQKHPLSEIVMMMTLHPSIHLNHLMQLNSFITNEIKQKRSVCNPQSSIFETSTTGSNLPSSIRTARKRAVFLI